MVCLAASIVSKNGKVLLSRQYVDMNRIRVEGLLAAFPKLVGTGKQHTYVETENVRYVYQPLEGMYLLLITNKQSNILEDLETLRLVSKVVPEYVDEVEESAVVESAFELLFAFDEVIAFGHKEEVTVRQVVENTEMNSNEAIIFESIIEAKRKEANSVMMMKAQEIDRRKAEQGKGAGANPWATNVMSIIEQAGSGSGGGGMGGGMDDSLQIGTLDTPVYNPAPTRSGPSKGMKLSKERRGNDLLAALAKEGEAVDVSASSLAPSAAPAVPAGPRDPVEVSVEETLTVRMNKEGGLESLEVQGMLTLLISDSDVALVQVALQMGRNTGMQFKPHPNIDRELYSTKQALAVKDPARPFPVNVPQAVLKWRFSSTDVNYVPISLNCWPTPSGAETDINIEYESTAAYDLHDVVITIPGVTRTPQVTSHSGQWQYDRENQSVRWMIELVDDSNRNGVLEMLVEAAPSDSFFPCTVDFKSNESICDIAVPQCLNTKTQAPTRFGFSKTLKTKTFQVVY